jgi:hypothetical protein
MATKRKHSPFFKSSLPPTPTLLHIINMYNNASTSVTVRISSEDGIISYNNKDYTSMKALLKEAFGRPGTKFHENIMVDGKKMGTYFTQATKKVILC